MNDETRQSGFSQNEKREIVRLVNDPEKIKSAIQIVANLKREIRSNQDLEWEQFADQHPQLEELRGSGLDIIKNNFSSYKKARQASKYWESELEESDGNLVKVVDQLKLPSNISIERHNISFVNSTCVIRLPDSSIREIFAGVMKVMVGNDEKHGEESNVEGMALHEHLLDQDGNRCPVILLSDTSSSTVLDHELEHQIYGDYYARFRDDTGQSEPNNSLVKKQLNVHYGEKFTLEQTDELIRSLKNDLLKPVRTMLLYNEIVANAGGSSSSQDLLDVTFILLNLPNIGDVLHIHPYSKVISDALSGYTSFINSTSLPVAEKQRAIFELQSEVAVFEDQNQLINAWVSELRDLTPDKDTFVASLEVIPISRIWAIGSLIDRDPKELKNAIEVNSDELKSNQDERAIWRMFLDDNTIDMVSLHEEAEQITSQLEAALENISFDDLETFESTVLPKIYASRITDLNSSLAVKIDATYETYRKNGLPVKQSTELLKFECIKKLMNIDFIDTVQRKLSHLAQESGKEYREWAPFMVKSYQYYQQLVGEEYR